MPKYDVPHAKRELEVKLLVAVVTVPSCRCFFVRASRQNSELFPGRARRTASLSPPRDGASRVMRENPDARSRPALHAWILLAWLLSAFLGVAASEPAAQTDERDGEFDFQLRSLCSGDVDASTTPEAARCSTIAGSLVVTSHLHPAFTDAAALDTGASGSEPQPRGAAGGLLRVEGDVVVAPGAAETSLRGAFPELTHVGGSVVLRCTNLVILAVFPKLRRVGGDVRVVENARLLRMRDETRAAFPALDDVGGALVVEANPVLEHFAGFESLRGVGGGVRLARNAALKSLDGVERDDETRADAPPFPALTRVAGSLVVDGNERLERVRDAFPSLETVRDGAFAFANMSSLRAIERSFGRLSSVAGGSLSVSGCASLETIDASFDRVVVAEGDFVLSETPALRTVRGGSFTRIGAVAGSVTVRNTALESLSFLLSLGVVRGDLDVGDGCPNLRSLDGLQNLRSVAGSVRVAPESLEGNFGRCGAVSSKLGVTHTCYARGFRVCAPLFSPLRSGVFEHEASDGATPRARATTVPGWYRCVDTLATALVETPELRTSAAVFAAAGLLDALHAPRADVTLFAPTDVGWLRAVGRVGDVLSRARAGPDGQSGKSGVRAVALAHVVAGARSLRSIKDGRVLPSVTLLTRAGGFTDEDAYDPGTPADPVEAANARRVVGLRASAKFGAFFAAAPVLATRCAARPGVSEACAPRPTRAVTLEPAWRVGLEGAHARDVGTRSPALHARTFETSARSGAIENILARFDADAGRFDDAADAADADAETSNASDSEANDEKTSFASSASTHVAYARSAPGLTPGGAAVVLGDLRRANGVAHVVDAPLAPPGAFASAPARDPPFAAFSAQTHDAKNVPIFLRTPPPPAPAATVAPPPVLMPVAAYFTAPPPPPRTSWLPPPPRAPGAASPAPPPPRKPGDSGSCAARAPDICGLCDYTFSETVGVCCCDESCIASGDCCADYQAVCRRAD